MASTRWHTDPATCDHSNDNVCPCCDFDGYYARTYPDCPWREPDETSVAASSWVRGAS